MEFQAVVGDHTVLETESWFSARAVVLSVLSPWATSLDSILQLLFLT